MSLSLTLHIQSLSFPSTLFFSESCWLFLFISLYEFYFLIYFLFIGVFYFQVEQFIKGIKEFFFLVCAGSLLLCGLSSNFSKQGPASLPWCAWASHCGGFSCCRARSLGHWGFSSCGSWILEHSLNSCDAGV